ncbi:hypothetical protein VNI00_010414 [Paramarasmius palmivorus]|uniref:RRM domain-containing protein n=1 Tax=Paramarasmius palmivorus TaxID=297713 RepID=A0AAW0CGC4_9AGAR
MTSSLRPFRWLNTCSHHYRHFHVSASLKASRSVKIKGLPLTYDDLRPYEPIEHIQLYRDKTAYINFLDYRVASQFVQSHSQNAYIVGNVTRVSSSTLIRLWRGESRSFVWKAGDASLATGVEDVREQFKKFGTVLDVEELESSTDRRFRIAFTRLDDAAEATKSYPSEDITHLPFDVGSVQQTVRTFPNLDPIPKFYGTDEPGMAHNLVHIRGFVPNVENWTIFRSLTAWLEVESCRMLGGDVLAVKFVEPVHSTFFIHRINKTRAFKLLFSWPEQSVFSHHRWLCTRMGASRQLMMDIPTSLETEDKDRVREIEAKLKEEFSPFGVVINVTIYRRQGYVEFVDIDSAVEARRAYTESEGSIGVKRLVILPQSDRRSPYKPLTGSTTRRSLKANETW